MKLDSLVNLPISGLFAILNDIDKKVYVLYTCNIYVAMGKLLTSIKDGSSPLSQDVKKLELVVIETMEGDIKVLRAKYDYWLSHYKTMGYSNYRNYQDIAKYKLRIQYTKINDEIIHVVYLVSRKSKKHLLAAFRTAQEADSWVLESFPNNTYYFKYADNALTQRLRRMYGGM